MRLLLATRNKNKTRQIALALEGRFIVTDLTSAECAGLPEVEETGATFEENAVLKAVTISRLVDPEMLVLADDSGICVEALGGAPGVYSARFSGPSATDATNNAKLQEELARVGAVNRSQRGAYYQCVLALARGGELLHTTEGRAEGWLLAEPRGTGGFGYDPYFVPNGLEPERTFAELTDQEKLPFNHRGKALAAMLEHLTRLASSP